jgi:hypothetical protein
MDVECYERLFKESRQYDSSDSSSSGLDCENEMTEKEQQLFTCQRSPRILTSCSKS